VPRAPLPIFLIFVGFTRTLLGDDRPVEGGQGEARCKSAFKGYRKEGYRFSEKAVVSGSWVILGNAALIFLTGYGRAMFKADSLVFHSPWSFADRRLAKLIANLVHPDQVRAVGTEYAD
jgi:hypothetical protein